MGIAVGGFWPRSGRGASVRDIEHVISAQYLLTVSASGTSCPTGSSASMHPSTFRSHPRMPLLALCNSKTSLFSPPLASFFIIIPVLFMHRITTKLERAIRGAHRPLTTCGLCQPPTASPHRL
ncbi:hypothetical protein BJX62DRAFT_142440 [Aspergillus germanicus]